MAEPVNDVVAEKIKDLRLLQRKHKQRDKINAEIHALEATLGLQRES